MIVAGIACDECETFVPSEEPPDDWFEVVRKGEIADICSAECLRKRAEGRTKKAPSKRRVPCPDCGKKFARAGLATHRTRAHR